MWQLCQQYVYSFVSWIAKEAHYLLMQEALDLHRHCNSAFEQIWKPWTYLHKRRQLLWLSHPIINWVSRQMVVQEVPEVWKNEIQSFKMWMYTTYEAQYISKLEHNISMAILWPEDNEQHTKYKNIKRFHIHEIYMPRHQNK